MADPLWFKYLEGVDDPPESIPVGYDGTVTLQDAGWAGLHPKAQAAFKNIMAESFKVGIGIRMTEGYRPRRRQAYLYALGRDIINPDAEERWRKMLKEGKEAEAIAEKTAKPMGGVVTKVKPGASKHQSGRAFDICIIGKDPYNEDQLAKVGRIGMAMGYTWGGSWEKFQDTPHFEVG